LDEQSVHTRRCRSSGAKWQEARGAVRLQTELTKLRAAGDNAERVGELEQILGSVKIVDPPDAQSENVSFGATVTVRDAEGKSETYRVVGVDELDFVPNAVSWISPLGKRLLASELGHRITLEDGRTAKIVKIE
jgi:transcription elongation GreA/GreB family factor